jgi:hypothetical protein
MRAGIVVLRNRVTLDLEDGRAPVPGPEIPGTWSSHPQGRTGWWSVIDAQGRRFLWLLLMDGVYAGAPSKIVGYLTTEDEADNARVRALAEASDNAWTIKQLRTDPGARATAIRAAWRMYRRDADGNPVGPQRVLKTIAGWDCESDSEAFDAVAGVA